MLDHLVTGERLSAVVERPAEQKEVVQQRVRLVSHLAVEVDDNRAEGFWRERQPQRLGDPGTVVVRFLELVVLEILTQLPLAELLGAPGLGHIRQMRVGRQRVAQRRGYEDLSGRVRQVLDGADDVRDREIVVVDGARQMIQTRAIGALHDVVLLERPLEFDITPDEIVKGAHTVAGHTESDDRASALRFKRCRLSVGLGHPASAVEEPVLLALRRLAFGLNLFGGGIVAVGVAGRHQPLHRRPIPIAPLRLVVGRIGPIGLGALVPVEAKPAEAVQNRPQCLDDVALGIGVVDPQQKLSAVPSGEQPVEQSSADAANVEIAGRAGREPCADRHRVSTIIMTVYWRCVPRAGPDVGSLACAPARERSGA